jgi:DNA-binding response OmpR family regulator
MDTKAIPPQGPARRILLVEDEYFLADELSQAMNASGLTVVGPAPTVAAAKKLLDAEHVDAAVLDINLRGEMIFSLAAALRERGVPFLFATGYDSGVIPDEYADVPHVQKPFDTDALARELVAWAPR